MAYLRMHKKVFVWWWPWLAVQVVLMWEFSFGIRIEPKRPLIDVFVGPFTIALGKHPALTDERCAQRHAGRGFFYVDAALHGFQGIDEANSKAVL